MDRNQAKELLPFIKAFSEGKDIEIRSKNTHAQLNGLAKMDEFIFGNFEYRIKPEPKYHPFENAEECWNEMLKHQPFGWVKDTEANEYLNVYCISNSASSIDLFGRMFKRCIFIDGSPCGIKVEE